MTDQRCFSQLFVSFLKCLILEFSQTSVDAAIAGLNGSDYQGRTLQVSRSQPPKLGTTESEHTIFIPNLPPQWNAAAAEQKLRDFLELVRNN